MLLLNAADQLGKDDGPEPSTAGTKGDHALLVPGLAAVPCSRAAAKARCQAAWVAGQPASARSVSPPSATAMSLRALALYQGSIMRFITVLPLTPSDPTRLAQPVAPHRSHWSVNRSRHASELLRVCACSARGRSNGRCSLCPRCSRCAAWGASCQGAAGDHQVLPSPPPAGMVMMPLFCLHACTGAAAWQMLRGPPLKGWGKRCHPVQDLRLLCTGCMMHKTLSDISYQGHVTSVCRRVTWQALCCFNATAVKTCHSLALPGHRPGLCCCGYLHHYHAARPHGSKKLLSGWSLVNYLASPSLLALGAGCQRQ